jgi:hypothetical protein
VQANMGYRAGAVADEVRGFSRSFRYCRNWRWASQVNDSKGVQKIPQSQVLHFLSDRRFSHKRFARG